MDESFILLGFVSSPWELSGGMFEGSIILRSRMVENENLFHDYGMRKNTTLRISFFVFLYIYYDGVDLNFIDIFTDQCTVKYYDCCTTQLVIYF